MKKEIETIPNPSRCLYCNTDLDSIRNPDYPKLARNPKRYCSKSCMVLHSKMASKRSVKEVDLITWGETFVRVIYHHKCNNPNRKTPHWPLSFDLPTRNTRGKNFFSTHPSSQSCSDETTKRVRS